MDYKIIKANRTEYLLPVYLQLRPVVVEPNLSYGRGPHFTSWICEEAAPQAATEERLVILCDACFSAQKAGARIEGIA